MQSDIFVALRKLVILGERREALGYTLEAPLPHHKLTYKVST